MLYFDNSFRHILETNTCTFSSVRTVAVHYSALHNQKYQPALMHALRIVNDDMAVRALLQDLTAADTGS